MGGRTVAPGGPGPVETKEISGSRSAVEGATAITASSPRTATIATSTAKRKTVTTTTANVVKKEQVQHPREQQQPHSHLHHERLVDNSDAQHRDPLFFAESGQGHQGHKGQQGEQGGRQGGVGLGGFPESSMLHQLGFYNLV